MRRGVLGLAVVAGLAILALWGSAWVDRAGARPGRRPTVPRVFRGADVPSVAERDVYAEDRAMVRCRAPELDDAGSLLAMRDDHSSEMATGGADLTLALDPGTWSLYWERPDGKVETLGKVTLAAGDVLPCRLAAGPYTLSGQVQDLDGEGLGGVWVGGCGIGRNTNAEGRFSLTLSKGCEIRAWWRDGLLSRPSTVAYVGPLGTDSDVILEVDTTPVAGMGLAFDLEPEGVRVTRVHPNTPAEAAGVRAGDLIARVDGTATAGLAAAEFVELGTGAEGSIVALDLQRDGRDVPLRFRRERLPDTTTAQPAIGLGDDTG